MKKLRKSISHMNLYADGTLVVVCTDRVRGLSINYVDVYEKYAEASFSVGRVHFSNGGAFRVLKDSLVRVSEPSVRNGSENTRNAGLAIGGVTIENKFGYLHFARVADLLTPDIDYCKDGYDVTFEQIVANGNWANYQIRKVFRARKNKEDAYAATA